MEWEGARVTLTAWTRLGEGEGTDDKEAFRDTAAMKSIGNNKCYMLKKSTRGVRA